MKALTAKDLMTKEVFTVSADTSVEQLVELLLSRSISGAPVIGDRGKLIGVVSITDVTRNRGRSGDDRSGHLHDYYANALERQIGREDSENMSIDAESELTVADIMTPVVFQVSEDAPVQQVADEMLKGHIHRVFVTDGENLVGVISAFDMLRVVRDL